jgi:hypothetical protein
VIRDRRLRGQLGYQFLDPALGLPARLGQDGIEVLGGQVRGQEPDRGQVQRARRQVGQGYGEAAYGPRGLDAIVGGVLGEVHDQRGRGLALASGEGLHLREEFAIGQVRDAGEHGLGVHALPIAWGFRRP